MAKAKTIGQLVEAAMDMSKSARMKRAKDMGFDTGTKYIHETASETPIKRIHDEGRFGGIFTLPDERAGYFDNVQEFYLKGEPFTDSDIISVAESNHDKVSDLVRRHFGSDADIDEYVGYAATFDNVPHEVIENDYESLQNLRTDIARLGGANAVTQPDEFSNTVQILGGPGARDVNAAFDPSKADSSDLLAGFSAPSAMMAAAAAPKTESSYLGGIGNAAMEAMSAVNRGAVDSLNFLGPDQINAILALSGSEKRAPDLYDVPGVQGGTEGNYMDDSSAKDFIRLLGEFLSPL